MTVAAILVVVFAAIVGLVIGSLGFRALRTAQAEQTPKVDLPSLGARVESFVGGARWPRGNATYPLARLDFHQYGVRVHGAVRPLDRVVPDWRCTYDEIGGAEPVDAPGRLGTGLRLRQAPRNSWIVFWTMGRVEDLVARLASMGVPTTTQHQKISFWTGSTREPRAGTPEMSSWKDRSTELPEWNLPLRWSVEQACSCAG